MLSRRSQGVSRLARRSLWLSCGNFGQAYLAEGRLYPLFWGRGFEGVKGVGLRVAWSYDPSRMAMVLRPSLEGSRAQQREGGVKPKPAFDLTQSMQVRNVNVATRCERGVKQIPELDLTQRTLRAQRQRRAPL